MASRKKKKKQRQKAKVKKIPLNNPFRDKAKELRKSVNQAQITEPVLPVQPLDEISKEDEADFLAAMSDVTPLQSKKKTALPTIKPKAPNVESEDLEVLAHLADLVSGDAILDVKDTDEYVEGSQPGLTREIIEKLSLGLFPVHDHLDLHGLTVSEAEEEVFKFIHKARQLNHRCVLIIHGRGLRSEGGRPVLKKNLIAWLSRSNLRKYVLAFTTARPYDGGAGAVYVLLKG